MSFQSKGFEAVAGIEPERALNIGMGVAQAPLWAAFYASAGIGAAFWWSTAWARGLRATDFAALTAPAAPAEAYIEALDDAVCDLIETSQDEAEDVAEVVEAVTDSAEFASEAASEAVSDAAEAVIDAIPEPLIETVEAPLEAELAQPAATEAAAEPLAFAAAEEPPVVELVTLEPSYAEASQDKPIAEPTIEAPKASKKKSKT